MDKNTKVGKKEVMESELAVERRRTKGMIDTIDKVSAIVEFDLDGTIINANQIFLDVMGYQLDEIVGKHHRMFVKSEESSSEKYKQFWNDLKAGKSFSDVFKRVAKNGKEVWIQGFYAPVFDDCGRIVNVIKVATDITKQENERLHTNGMIAAINKTSAVIEFEVDGTVITANQNFLDVMGYQLDEIVGKHHRLFVAPEESSSPKYKQFWDDLRAGKSFYDVFRRIGKNGKEVWIQGFYSPVFDSSDRVVNVIKIATDMTDEKMREMDVMKKVDNILEVVGAAAEGDLTKHIIVDGTEPVDLVCSALKQLIATLRDSMQSIAKNTEALSASSEELTAIGQQMAGTAEETSTQSNIVSSSSEVVSQNIQTLAAGAEELNASIKEIAKNTNDAARVASQAVSFTEEANITMSKLGESSAQIGNVVKVITSIAQQTNLLALNATIEAARAGEAGKGFAVVANEVKELAKETAKATEDISRKIESIQTDTQASLTAINRISNIIKEINETQITIASAVEEQSATTNEMGRNVADAAQGSAEISENILGVAQAAKDTAEGASNNQLAAQDLSRMASELQKIVSHFKYDSRS